MNKKEKIKAYLPAYKARLETVNGIALKVGCHRDYVIKVAREFGEYRKSYKEIVSSYIERYEQDEVTAQGIANTEGVSVDGIRSALTKLGVKKKKTKTSFVIDKYLELRDAKKWRFRRYLFEEVAKQTGASVWYVKQIIYSTGLHK